MELDRLKKEASQPITYQETNTNNLSRLKDEEKVQNDQTQRMLAVISKNVVVIPKQHGLIKLKECLYESFLTLNVE